MHTLPMHFIRNCLAYGALTLAYWDTIITFHHEYQHIWKSRWTWVKALYLTSRYVVILYETIRVILLETVYSGDHVSRPVCMIGHGLEMLAFLYIFTALEAVLSLRLYALYHCNRNVGIILVFACVSGLVVASICGIRTIYLLDYDGCCNSRTTPYEALYFTIYAIVRHVILWLMTIHKRNVAVKDTGERAPVVRLVLRDGAWILAAIVGIFAMVVPYSFAIQTAAHVLYPWPIVALGILTCRIILNMQKLPTETPSITPELTTFSTEFETEYEIEAYYNTDSNRTSESKTCEK